MASREQARIPHRFFLRHGSCNCCLCPRPLTCAPACVRPCPACFPLPQEAFSKKVKAAKFAGH